MGLDALLNAALGVALSNVAGSQPAAPWAAGASQLGSVAPVLGELVRQLPLQAPVPLQVSALQQVVRDSRGNRYLCDVGYSWPKAHQLSAAQHGSSRFVSSRNAAFWFSL